MGTGGIDILQNILVVIWMAYLMCSMVACHFASYSYICRHIWELIPSV